MGEVVMPRLSDSMEEGTILKWLVSEGEAVERGQDLVEIETDKANMTYEADAAGVLGIIAAEGQTLAVGQPIAQIGGADTAGREPETSAPPAPEPDLERIKASPIARRIAKEDGVDLKSVEGTGPGGRIVKADVEQERAEREPPSAVGRQPTAKGEARIQELTKIQQTVARRMAESKATAPEFDLHAEIDMGLCVELRKRLEAVSDPAPSFNDMIVKAVALALREHPRANGSYRDGHWELYERVNVGVAVAANESLVVPTIFGADGKSLGEISREARALIEKVRDGSVTPPELSGGTFTVSNLGMYGVDRFTAIINPPQAATLAVGALKRKPVADDAGRIMAAHMMSVTLVCDHRILYGADAAEFLARIRELLEQPLALSL